MTYLPPSAGEDGPQQPVAPMQQPAVPATQPAVPATYGYPQQHPYPQQYPYPAGAYAPPRPTNTLAVITLVLALVSVSIGAVITGHISLGQMAKTGEQGRGIALAGLIIGYVGCGFWVLFWLGMLVLPAFWAMMIAASVGTAGV